MRTPGRVALLLVLTSTMAAASCSSRSNLEEGVFPTSPTSTSAGRSPAAGPGASYDASGMWHFVVTDLDGDEVENFTADVDQDSDGNLTFLDPEGFPITLKRLGTGLILTYRQSDDVEEDGCEIRIQSNVRLDTRTNTLSGNLLLRVMECTHEVSVQRVTATKLS